MVTLGSPENNCENIKFPVRISLRELYFQQLFLGKPRETYFIVYVSTGSLFFLQTNSQWNRIPLGTLFLTIIPMGIIAHYYY
jgi:hypothetical protein